jgi:hypothetical protein
LHHEIAEFMPHFRDLIEDQALIPVKRRVCEQHASYPFYN